MERLSSLHDRDSAPLEPVRGVRSTEREAIELREPRRPCRRNPPRGSGEISRSPAPLNRPCSLATCQHRLISAPDLDRVYSSSPTRCSGILVRRSQMLGGKLEKTSISRCASSVVKRQGRACQMADEPIEEDLLKSPTVSEDDPQVLEASIIASHRRFSGPLPPPEDFERYEAVLPGSTNRILTMAEKEQDHRHVMNRDALGASVDSDRRSFQSHIVSSLTYMVVSVCALATLGYAIHSDTPAFGIAGGIALLPVMISVLRGVVQSRQRSDDQNSNMTEREEDAQPSPDAN